MEVQRYKQYIDILREELIPAMGCTEPIALAYAAAVGRQELGCLPERILARVSSNIIKNVKSVVVPNTGGLRGIPAAVAAGAVAGDSGKKLEVISRVTAAQIAAISAYLAENRISVENIMSGFVFDIELRMEAGTDNVLVRIVGNHTNLVQLVHNGKKLIDLPVTEQKNENRTDRSILSVAQILEFADTLRPEDVSEIFDRQIAYNWAIAEEGMKHPYGANIGKVLRTSYGEGVSNRARYMAAAGSDARMNGCDLPVVINSGSGNQGITASVPVIVYAQELGKDREALYRALAVSNLCTIHIKSGIGTLSAYCGAVTAGCGAAAGIAYLNGGGLDEVKHTLVNAMAIDSGIICDGAKASCAAKIASAVDAGLLGYQMYMQGNEFLSGDGIVKKNVEETISTVGSLAHNGMCDTDVEILRLMLED